MAGNEDYARRQADDALAAAQRKLDSFSSKQFEPGDGARQREAEIALASARNARDKLG